MQITKSSFFKNWIDLISQQYRDRIENGIENLPDSFWTDPPSLSGKYHPAFDHGYGGIVRHVIMALTVASDLIRADFDGKEFTQRDIDIIYIALLFHDAVKINEEGHSSFEHPLDSAIFCNQYVTGNTEIEDDVFCCIRSHMGRWNTSEKSDKVLHKPISINERLVHMADYIASRKYVMYYPDAMNDGT